MNRSLHIGLAVTTIGVVMLLGWRADAANQQAGPERPIAHVIHDGIHFSVSLDRRDNRFLAIVVPERTGIQPRPITVKVRLRDESILEGAVERQPSAGGGGFVDWRYRFDAKRPLAVAGIFSVTIGVGNQSFEVMPW